MRSNYLSCFFPRFINWGREKVCACQTLAVGERKRRILKLFTFSTFWWLRTRDGKQLQRNLLFGSLKIENVRFVFWTSFRDRWNQRLRVDLEYFWSGIEFKWGEVEIDRGWICRFRKVNHLHTSDPKGDKSLFPEIKPRINASNEFYARNVPFGMVMYQLWNVSCPIIIHPNLTTKHFWQVFVDLKSGVQLCGQIVTLERLDWGFNANIRWNQMQIQIEICRRLNDSDDDDYDVDEEWGCSYTSCE